MNTLPTKCDSEATRRELWECLKAAGADCSPLTDYAEPWNHMQPGEALQAVNELRKDYDDDRLFEMWEKAAGRVKEVAEALRPIAAISHGRIAHDWDQISAKEALAIWKLARELNDLPTGGEE